jgi:uncharacterized membrane protein
MKTFLSLSLIVSSLLGMLDSGYITYEKISGLVPQCSIHFQCGQVLNSSWASVGPIPLAVLGFFFYSLFFGVALWFYFGRKEISFGHFRIRTEKMLAFQGIFGGAFSLYLLFIMGVVLQAWCLYCLLSAMICIILFITSSVLYIQMRRETV